METSDANSPREIDKPLSRWHLLPLTLAVFASFFAYSALQTPVPGANEPHYLAKAKHCWDRSFARGDLFLESTDAHPVFYYTVGALTRFLTLEQTVWTGRVLAYGLLAVGWTAMLARVLPGRWSPLAVAWVFLALTRLGDLPRTLEWPATERYGLLHRFVLSISGEWLVGGLEAKIFAYGFVFWSLAMWWSGRRRWAAVLAGLAVSFHPIVGIWAIFAAVTSA